MPRAAELSRNMEESNEISRVRFSELSREALFLRSRAKVPDVKDLNWILRAPSINFPSPSLPFFLPFRLLGSNDKVRNLMLDLYANLGEITRNQKEFSLHKVYESLPLLLFRSVMAAANQGNPETAQSVYEFNVKDIKGNDVSLEKYRGHVLIIVNVASKCGYTAKHYAELNEIYDQYAESKGELSVFLINAGRVRFAFSIFYDFVHETSQLVSVVTPSRRRKNQESENNPRRVLMKFKPIYLPVKALHVAKIAQSFPSALVADKVLLRTAFVFRFLDIHVSDIICIERKERRTGTRWGDDVPSRTLCALMCAFSLDLTRIEILAEPG